MERIKASRGPKLRCKGWRQEAILRMLEKKLANGDKPDVMIIYGGAGTAARNWEAYRRIVDSLQSLRDDETLIVQSGKPVAVFKTHRDAPRVLIANAHLVPKWSNWETFYELEALGLTMYGQMTAGGWSYIGSQGIVQGTYETFAACARKHFGGSLKGRLVLTGGMGGMGGAQPLAVKMNEGVCLDVEVEEARIRRRVANRYCDRLVSDLDEALQMALAAKSEGTALSIGLVGNCAEVHPELVRRGIRPDVVTDQTSAHDPLGGYIPKGLTVETAAELRTRDPQEYVRRSRESIPIRTSDQPDGGFRRAERTDRDHAGPSRRRLGRVSLPRDGGDAGSVRRDRRLADPERPPEHRRWGGPGRGAQRWRRGDRVLDPCGRPRRVRRDGGCRPTDRPGPHDGPRNGRRATRGRRIPGSGPLRERPRHPNAVPRVNE